MRYVILKSTPDLVQPDIEGGIRKTAKDLQLWVELQRTKYLAPMNRCG